MTQRGHTVIATILVLTGLLFMRVGSIEVQPWDEGLYAMRARAIVEHDVWMDQTPYTIGGLYSSTPPPMPSWAMAVSMRALGPSTTSIRLFGLLCSTLAMAMLYLVMRRIVTFEHALVSVVVLASALPWWWYARQGMSEVPLMAFMLTALWASIKLAEGWKWGALVFAAAFGSALLTKMAVSFLPLLFLVPLLVQRRSAGMIGLCIGAAIGGIAMAAPWYANMAAIYGDDFLLALTVPHVAYAVEGNAGSLGPLYYVNQLVVAQPLLAAAMLFVAAAVVNRRLLPDAHQTSAISGIAWFVVSMLLFSVSATKNPHYVVMLLPSAVITAIYGLERILLHASRRLSVAVYGAVVASALWAVMPDVRSSMRFLLQDGMVAGVVAAMVLLTVLPWVIKRSVVDRLTISLLKPVIYGVCALMLIRVAWLTVGGHTAEIRGGREIAKIIRGGSARTFDYLFHRHNAGDAFNPQLDWYLGGWMSAWMITKTYTPVALPAKPEATLDDVMRTAAGASGTYVVYYHPGNDTYVQAVTEALADAYRPVPLDDAPHYTLYRRKAQNIAPY